MIEGYRFGRIVVEDVEYKRDLLIFPDRVESDWWRIEGHKLHVEDIRKILDFEPEVLVVGKGAYGRMKITDEAETALSDKGIQVIAKKTDEACKEYNDLIKKGKKAVAALHLTC
jgi:hypothetical protein